MSRRKVSLSQKIRNLLAEGKTPKEIAKILKCEPQKVYSVKYHMRRKQEGIAALPTKKPDDLMPVTHEEAKRPGSFTTAPTPPQAGDNSVPIILGVLVAFAVAMVIALNLA